ncbi:MAG: Gfo/Idh/MocA family protein [Nocardioidaceae bacterium]
MTDAARQDTDDGPCRFAVVGGGVIGQHHAKVISHLEGAELTVVVDEAQDTAERLAAAYGAVPVVKLEEALTRADVDAVAVCTPSGIHAEQATVALEAGRHVVVEKPVDISLEAATRLVDVEARSSAVATVISQHRFDPASRAVHEAVRTGRLGDVTSAVATVSWWRSQSYYDSGGWRGTWALDGGGALMNQSIHTLDLMVWMLGRPVEVTAYAACLAHTDVEVEDTAVAIVKFDSGALGVVHATTAAYPGLTARMQIHGSEGSAIIDDDHLQYFHARSMEPGSDAPAYGGGMSTNQATMLLPESGEGAAPTAGADPAAVSAAAHSLQYLDFIDAIRSRRPPEVTVRDAATTLEVVLAVYRSAAEGRPVRVSADVGSP